MKRILFLLLALPALVVNAQDRIQLKEFRAKFVNQRISINPNFTEGNYGFLGAWNFVKEKKGKYETDYGHNVPAGFVGKTGTIIAVVAPDAGYGEPPANQSDDAFVRWGEAIVKLDSGELVRTALYLLTTGSNPSDGFTLLAVREQHKQESFALAQKLHGKSLYLTTLTRVYDMGLTTEKIQLIKEGVGYSEAVIHDVPLLTPLPVIDTRYSEQQDFMLVVLQLPNDRKALYVPGCIMDVVTEQRPGCASLAMPPFLSEHEVAAIREGKIFVGMSEPALYMAIGFPLKTNASAVGATQLVYHTAYIYLEDKKVRDFQTHD